jgi:hypothetical protein
VSVTGNDILAYFATRQDKLFVLIVSPPPLANDTDAAHAANARAVANWLVNDWLATPTTTWPSSISTTC